MAIPTTVHREPSVRAVVIRTRIPIARELGRALERYVDGIADGEIPLGEPEDIVDQRELVSLCGALRQAAYQVRR